MLPSHRRALSSGKLVKKHKRGFILSFIGLTRYFLSRFGDEQFRRMEVKRIV